MRENLNGDEEAQAQTIAIIQYYHTFAHAKVHIQKVKSQSPARLEYLKFGTLAFIQVQDKTKLKLITKIQQEKKRKKYF